MAACCLRNHGVAELKNCRNFNIFCCAFYFLLMLCIVAAVKLLSYQGIKLLSYWTVDTLVLQVRRKSNGWRTSTVARVIHVAYYMGHTWVIHGSHMCHTCVIHGSYMVHTYVIHGFYTLVIYVSYMRHTCVIQVSYMGHTCVIHGSYMRHTCVIHVSYMCHTCVIHGLYMGQRCVIDGIAVGGLVGIHLGMFLSLSSHNAHLECQNFVVVTITVHVQQCTPPPTHRRPAGTHGPQPLVP